MFDCTKMTKMKGIYYSQDYYFATTYWLMKQHKIDGNQLPISTVKMLAHPLFHASNVISIPITILCLNP